MQHSRAFNPGAGDVIQSTSVKEATPDYRYSLLFLKRDFWLTCTCDTGIYLPDYICVCFAVLLLYQLSLRMTHFRKEKELKQL